MKRTTAALSVLILLALSGCAAQVDTQAEQEALLATDREWSVAASSGDTESSFPFWTDDAIIYFAGTPPVVGKDAIRSFVLENQERPGFLIGWEPTTAVVAASGDFGYTLGTFQVTVNGPDGNPVTRHGKYASIWKKQADGSWKCVVESSSFNQ